MNKANKIARDRSPSSVRLSKAGQSASSPGCPATTLDHQKTTHRGLGACRCRDGASRCDALFPADLTLLGEQGCTLFRYDLLTNLAGPFYGPGSFGQFAGIEAGTSHLVANLIHNRRERAFQALRQRLPDHFSAPAAYVPERSHGASHCAEQTSQGRGNV